jgi:hypothetical protein
MNPGRSIIISGDLCVSSKNPPLKRDSKRIFGNFQYPDFHIIVGERIKALKKAGPGYLLRQARRIWFAA